jgi:hypothetical protein
LVGVELLPQSLGDGGISPLVDAFVDSEVIR